MSVALFDLKCPSYDYVRKMTWAEFLIRLHGFRRNQETDMMMLRELSWVVYTAPHNDPKKMKKSIEGFWPIKKGAVVNNKQKMIDAMKKAQEKYLEEKRLKDGLR
jgi:hypothetical protein